MVSPILCSCNFPDTYIQKLTIFKWNTLLLKKTRIILLLTRITLFHVYVLQRYDICMLWCDAQREWHVTGSALSWRIVLSCCDVITVEVVLKVISVGTPAIRHIHVKSKIQSCLCFTKSQKKATCTEISLHILTSALDGGKWWDVKKEPLIPTDRRTGGLSQSVYGKEVNLFSCQELNSDPPVAQPTA